MELHLEWDQPHYEEPWQAKSAGRTGEQMDKQSQGGLTDGEVADWQADRRINAQIDK